MCAYLFSSERTSSYASRCTGRLATLSPFSFSTPMTGRDSKLAVLTLLRGSRWPDLYSVRLTLHEQRRARAHAPALALLPFLPSLFLLTAGGGHISSFHPTSDSGRSFTPTQLLVSRRTSPRPRGPQARLPSRCRSASGHGRTRDRAVQTSSMRPLIGELLRAGAMTLMVRASS
jgi:hypothetical protein